MPATLGRSRCLGMSLHANNCTQSGVSWTLMQDPSHDACTRPNTTNSRHCYIKMESAADHAPLCTARMRCEHSRKHLSRGPLDAFDNLAERSFAQCLAELIVAVQLGLAAACRPLDGLQPSRSTRRVKLWHCETQATPPRHKGVSTSSCSLLTSCGRARERPRFARRLRCGHCHLTCQQPRRI
jgi:hypothetical protein